MKEKAGDCTYHFQIFVGRRAFILARIEDLAIIRTMRLAYKLPKFGEFDSALPVCV